MCRGRHTAGSEVSLRSGLRPPGHPPGSAWSAAGKRQKRKFSRSGTPRPPSSREASRWFQDLPGPGDGGQGGARQRRARLRAGSVSGPTLVRSRCSGVAGPGRSPRALLLGDRLLPPRLSSAFCPLMLVQPGLAWSCGEQDLPEGSQGPLPHNPLSPLPQELASREGWGGMGTQAPHHKLTSWPLPLPPDTHRCRLGRAASCGRN